MSTTRIVSHIHTSAPQVKSLASIAANQLPLDVLWKESKGLRPIQKLFWSRLDHNIMKFFSSPQKIYTHPHMTIYYQKTVIMDAFKKFSDSEKGAFLRIIDRFDDKVSLDEQKIILTDLDLEWKMTNTLIQQNFAKMEQAFLIGWMVSRYTDFSRIHGFHDFIYNEAIYYSFDKNPEFFKNLYDHIEEGTEQEFFSNAPEKMEYFLTIVLRTLEVDMNQTYNPLLAENHSVPDEDYLLAPQQRQ